MVIVIIALIVINHAKHQKVTSVEKCDKIIFIDLNGVEVRQKIKNKNSIYFGQTLVYFVFVQISDFL